MPAMHLHVVSARWAKCLLAFLAILWTVRTQVIISEVMYHPPFREDLLEYLEIFNPSALPIQLTGYRLEPISFEFPDIQIEPGSFVVVASDKQALLRCCFCSILDLMWRTRAYSHLDPLIVTGNMKKTLKNSGSNLELYSFNGSLMSPASPMIFSLRNRYSVRYDDKLPWSPLADGMGSSLELTCLSNARSHHSSLWFASPFPGL